MVQAIDEPFVACPGVATRMRSGGKSRPMKRSTHNLSGLPTRGAVFSHKNTVGNLHRALRERVLFSIIEGELTETMRPVGDFATPGMITWQRRVSNRMPRGLLPVTHRVFCEKYCGLRRKRYETAAHNVARKGRGIVNGKVSAFLKAEKNVGSAAPRVISPRSPEYLLETGCYIEPLEKRLYKSVAEEVGHECIMKGFNLGDRARVVTSHWESFERPVAIGLDASKFDQHVSKQALRYEHRFYTNAYHEDKWLGELLKMQLDNEVQARLDDGIVNYKSKGGRMSGDMNTALGNCMLSAAMLYEWARIAGVKIKAVIDGDDCVAFMESQDEQKFLDGLREWYMERGFRMKIEATAFEMEAVEFCQCHPVKLSSGWMLVRNPVKAITQDHVWIEKGGITHSEVLAATGEGGVALYGNVPVLGAYYRMLRGTGKLSRAAVREMKTSRSWLRHLKGEDHGHLEVNDEARVSFWCAFGITPCHQVMMEQYFASYDLNSTLASNLLYLNHPKELTTLLQQDLSLFLNFIIQ